MKALMKALILIILIMSLETQSFATSAHVTTISQRCDNADSLTPCTEPSLTVSGSNTILLVCVHREDTTAGDRVVASVTHNGSALTQLVNQNNGNNDTSLWYKIAPDEGTFNVVATPNASACATFGFTSTIYSGVKQTGFPDAFVTDSDPANTIISTDIVTVTANDMIFECYQNSNSAATQFTQDSGQTERTIQLYFGARVGNSDELVGVAGTYTQQITTDGSGILIQILAAISEDTTIASTDFGDFFDLP